MRLRTLLALVFAGTALLLTSIGTVTVARFLSTRAQVRAEARMADLAGHLRQLIDTNISERLGDMTVLASVSTTTATSAGARRTWAEVTRDSYPAYAWIGFADANGVVTASTGGLLEGADVSARPWLQRGLKGASITDVHDAKLLASALPALPNGEPRRFVDVSAPLRDPAGSVVGVVGGHLDLKWMREMSRAAIAVALARDPGVEAMILAGDGTVVLGPGDVQGKRLEGRLPSLPALEAGAAEASAHGTWIDGSDVFVAAARNLERSDRPTLPWTVVVHQPTAIALATTREFVLQLALGGSVFAFLAAMLGWLAADHLAAPLRSLATAADRISGAAGETALPAPRGYVEIDHLTSALGSLLARLGERDRSLAAANAELERRVAQRTEELVEARDHAEAATRAKTDFLASMSHEIRTPLNGILGYTELLMDDAGLGAGQRAKIARIESAGAALLTVVNDILDFSKIEAGQIELDPEPFNAEALIDNTTSIVRGLADAKGLDLVVEIAPGLPAWLLGDGNRLRQVLLNLLNNAIKFTAAGRVMVSVGGVPPTGSGADTYRLQVRVADTGIGIPEEKQARLFQRFSQVDGSVTREFGGTGLGLAISKSLVELMGGEIGVDSTAGAGSTFWFAVPLTITSAPAAVAPQALRTDAVRSLRILLVEDVAINRDIARSVLESAGHRVVAACDGAAAVAAVRADDYDLVLMDVQMPVMDGMTATRQIRLLPDHRARLPIVAMTANVLPAQVAAFRDAGMDDHVGKPFKRDALLSAVARWAHAAEPAPVPCGDGATAASPILDRETYGSLLGDIGAPTMASLLDRLQQQLADRLAMLAAESAALDRDGLEREAHAGVSSAGLLGFPALSEACRALERACRDGALCIDPQIEQAARTTRETAAVIGALQETLAEAA